MDIVQKEYEKQGKNYDNLEQLEKEDGIIISPFGQLIQEFLDKQGKFHEDLDSKAGKNICKYLQENQYEMEDISLLCDSLAKTDSSHPSIESFIKDGGLIILNKVCQNIRSNGKESQENKNQEKDLHVFTKIVNALVKMPISAKNLTETKIGKGVNSIVKDGIFKTHEVSKTALNLVNRWKSLVDQSRSNN